MIALFLSTVERLNVVTLCPTILYVPPLRCTVWPVNYTPTPMESKGLIACLILSTAFYCTSLASDISSYVAVQSLTRVPCWCSALGVLVWESRVGAEMGVETTVHTNQCFKQSRGEVSVHMFERWVTLLSSCNCSDWAAGSKQSFAVGFGTASLASLS